MITHTRWRPIEVLRSLSPRGRGRGLLRLTRAAAATLVHEGPRHFAQRQWLWLRKRWYYRRYSHAAPVIAPDAPAASAPTAATAESCPQPRASSTSSPRHSPSSNSHSFSFIALARGDSLAHSGEHPLRVVYIAAVEELLSKRYRVDNILVRLRHAGVRANALWDIDVQRRRDTILRADIVVFQRLPGRPDLFDLVERLHERGVVVAYEADDYVFEPDALPYLRTLHDEPQHRIVAHQHYLADCRELLLRCGHFIGSTEFLAARAQELGCPSVVIGNGVNERQVALAERALAARAQEKGRGTSAPIRIAYLAGTATHRDDFAVAVPALARLLRDRPQVQLVIRGPLDVPSELAPFYHQVQREPFVSWERLIAATAALDVVLVPLEPNNPVNEAKSALKYFESALVRVPVIASPVGEYRRAISHGVNGILADSDDEWYHALLEFVDHHERRVALGIAAHQDALATYTVEAQSDATFAAFQALLNAHTDAAHGHSNIINSQPAR